MKKRQLRYLILWVVIMGVSTLLFTDTSYAAWIYQVGFARQSETSPEIRIDLREILMTEESNFKSSPLPAAAVSQGSLVIGVNGTIAREFERVSGSPFTATSGGAYTSLNTYQGSVTWDPIPLSIYTGGGVPEYEIWFTAPDVIKYTSPVGHPEKSIKWTIHPFVWLGVDLGGMREDRFYLSVDAQLNDYPPPDIPEPATIISSLLGLVGFALKKFRG